MTAEGKLNEIELLIIQFDEEEIESEAELIDRIREIIDAKP